MTPREPPETPGRPRTPRAPGVSESAGPTRANAPQRTPEPAGQPTRRRRREAPDDDLREELAAARAEVRLLVEQRDALQDRLDDAQASIASLTERVGRLTAKAEELDAVIRERDQLRTQLAEAQAALPRRVSDALQTQIGQVNEAHAAELRAVTAERDDLRAQLNTLEQQSTETATVITPTALASHFADVLAQQAEKPAGQHASAAVTSIQVQAKGLLRAPEAAGDDVQIVTVDAGKVDPAQMSTISLDLKLLPRLPQAAQPQQPQPQQPQPDQAG